MEAIDLIEKLKPSNTSTLDVSAWVASCYEAMNDDFNTTILMAHLFEGVRWINLVNDQKETLTAADIERLQQTMKAFVFDVLGLRNSKKEASHSDKLSGVIEMLIAMRNQARADKNWGLSDEIRDRLAALGITLKDGKDGTTFTL
jgi:cysteinyl-tRNA synthetase